MINTDHEKAALMMFSKNDQSEDYKRMMCYIVWHKLQKENLGRTLPLESFMNITSDLMMVDKQDIKSAIAALKTPQMGGVSVWNRRGTGLTLVQSKLSDSILTWINAVNKQYPHFYTMVQ